MGSCSSSTTNAVEGNNTISFNQLDIGTYSDCRLFVSNAAGTSDSLSIPSFTVRYVGTVMTPIGDRDDSAHDLALQSDGKIVAVGSSFNGTNDDIALVRYNSNGSLDMTFSGDGKQVTAIGSDDDVAHSVAIQTDGKIVVAGFSFNGTDKDFAIVRYNSDGSLDSSFGGDGRVATDFALDDDVVNSIAIQSNGKIVVAGRTVNSGDYNIALARYNTDGTLDATFGFDGTIAYITHTGASDMAIQSDGKIVVSFGGAGVGVIRLNSDGSPDTTFSDNGIVQTIFGDLAFANCITMQFDGKIVVAGQSWDKTSGQHVIVLARYLSNGNLDTSFNGDGKVTTTIGADIDNARSIAIQDDTKIVIAGYSNTKADGYDYDIILARYNSDGMMDSSFGDDGVLITKVEPYNYFPELDLAHANGMAIQNNGKIVITGYIEPAKYSIEGDFTLLRYNTDGSLDENFHP